MAATRLIALHINKGKTVAQCLADRTDYSQNAAKTEDGKYISSYECDPKTADEEFLLTKRQYQHITGRQQKNDIIAYQIRQSFKPGEITPEEANQVGYEAYRKSGYSIKFFEEHREEIQIHKAAKKAFDQLPGKKVPTRQSLNEEYHRLLSGKKEAYAEYRQVKKDMQEYLIAKQTVEHILGIDRKNRIITQQQNLD